MTNFVYLYMENWKSIQGYEGIYEVSDLGNIKTLKTGIITNGWTHNKYGHKKVRLYKNKIPKDYYLHRLVAIAFMPNIKNKPHINHIDNNPANNKANNLEWCTQMENMRHAANNNRMNTEGAKVFDTKNNIEYKSVKQLADKLGILPNTLIYKFIRGKGRWLHYEKAI